MIAVLVMLSIVLTAAVLYPGMGEAAILAILGGGTSLALGTAAAFLIARRGSRKSGRTGGGGPPGGCRRSASCRRPA